MHVIISYQAFISRQTEACAVQIALDNMKIESGALCLGVDAPQPEPGIQSPARVCRWRQVRLRRPG